MVEQGPKGYGKKNVNCHIKPDEEYLLYDLSVLDENDNVIHCAKVLIIFGSRFGFRGKNEHYQLRLDQIGWGYYPDDHPDFPGLKWWGVLDWGNFKAQYLSADSSYTYEDEWVARFPVLSDGVTGDVANDAGGAIERWVMKVRHWEKLNPNRQKVKHRFYRRVDKVKIHVNTHLGEGRISELIREGLRIMGITNWQTIRCHSTRHWFVNQLANSNVNFEEVRKAARHERASTTLTYCHTSKASKGQRVRALMNASEKPAAVKDVPVPVEKSGSSSGGVVENAKKVELKFTLSVEEGEDGSDSSVEGPRGPQVLKMKRASKKSSVEVVPAPPPVKNPYSKGDRERPAIDQVLSTPPCRGTAVLHSPPSSSEIQLRGRTSDASLGNSKLPARPSLPGHNSPGGFILRTPESYRTGPVHLSQSHCSPDRPISEATQMEYDALNREMEALRREQRRNDAMARRSGAVLSSRQNSLRGMREQVNQLRRNEARRQQEHERQRMRMEFHDTTSTPYRTNQDEFNSMYDDYVNYEREENIRHNREYSARRWATIDRNAREREIREIEEFLEPLRNAYQRHRSRSHGSGNSGGNRGFGGSGTRDGHNGGGGGFARGRRSW